jgi:tetratricopeptide (TPR) repeat protein
MFDDIVSMGEWETVSSFEALLSQGVDSVHPMVLRALRRADLSEALTAANRAYSQAGPRDLDVSMTYAILLLHRGLVDEAMGVLKRTLLTHAGAVGPQLLQIDALLAKQQNDRATDLMEGLEQIDVQDPRVWSYLGDRFLDVERVENARGCYERAVRYDTQDPGVCLKLAHIYLEFDRPHEAAQLFQQAGALAPSDLVIWNSVADSWFHVEEWEKAKEAYKRVLKLDPQDVRACVYLGLSHQELGNLDKALRCFQKACRIDSDDLENWLNVGHIQLRMRLAENARVTFQAVLDKESDNVEAINGIVVAAYELGDLDLALTYSRRGVEVDPERADSQYNLGIVCLDLCDFEQAEASFRTAVRLSPEDGQFLACLALTLLHRVRIDDALKLVNKAMSLGFDSVSAFGDFVPVLLRLGEREDVQIFLEQIDTGEAWVSVMLSFVECVALALEGADERFGPAVESFMTCAQAHSGCLPVDVDLDEFARLVAGLEVHVADEVAQMIAVLEGRRELNCAMSQSNL